MTGERPCRDCLDLGQEVAAHRILPGGTAVCDEHWARRLRQKLFPSKASAVKEETMPRTLEVDWEAVRREKRSGTPAAELAKKYGVHVSSIYAHVKNGNGHAGGARRHPGTNGLANASGDVSTADLLAALHKRRDALSAAIEALEGTEA